MTRPSSAEAGEYTAAPSYARAAQEGRNVPHVFGNSYENLVSLSGPLRQEQVPEPRLRQPAATVAAPERGEPCSPNSSSLDQYAPMLPSDPVARLPLLPCPSSTSASRVAAWLLGPEGPEGGAAAGGAAGASPNNHTACAELGCGASDSCSDADVAVLHAELEEEAPGVAAAQPRARGAVAADADGYRGAPSFYRAQRRSFEGFMRSTITNGDALNNYLGALY